ncbi:hypothetical protein IQ235_03380 [Oscillatoriales cyanobacterium LEGE 11467]|uniref:Uncharacterized protein n=1 Tax=Zarconia navalis LEGE 11467 TaxID=1828826 RepID=A0A928Z7U2_9CYAN|nr:hypothetical protein [Zarconia navalis]MBE9039834.1 hypothetical protein [Zarconia navalis LEGE 11467]
MNTNDKTQLFTELTTEESSTVNGAHSSYYGYGGYRPSSYGYGRGYSRWNRPVNYGYSYSSYGYGGGYRGGCY